MKSITNMVLNNTTGGRERFVIANDRNVSVWSKLFEKRSAVMEQQILHSGLFRFAADIGLSPVALRLNGPSSGGQRQRCCCFENRLSLLYYSVLKQYPIAKKNRGRSGMNGPDTQEVYLLVMTSRYFMMDENYSTIRGFTLFSAPG